VLEIEPSEKTLIPPFAGLSGPSPTFVCVTVKLSPDARLMKISGTATALARMSRISLLLIPPTSVPSYMSVYIRARWSTVVACATRPSFTDLTRKYGYLPI
jgi:hypothetical protein